MKTKTKKKQAANQGLVTKLRFPEFRDAGDWKRKALGFYLEQYSEKVPSSTDLDVYSSTRDGLKPQNEYYNGRQLVNDGEYGTVPNGYFVYRHMSDDDIFKFNINTLGKKIAVSKEYPVFKTVNLVSEFLVNKLNEGIEFKRFAASQKKGGTRTRLYFKTLCSFECSLPSFEEQQKIADCLSSLDELIAAQADKLDILKAHKKGLMQQLFPVPGQATPSLRFSEFQDAGEWNAEKLGEICKFVRGPFGGALKKDIFVKTGYAVYEQSHAIYQKFNSFRYFITEEKYDELKRFAVAENDIIMSCSGTMGKFAIVPKDSKEGVINQALLKLTVRRGFNIDFIKYTLELPGSQEKLLSQSAGGAIKNVVGVKQLKEIEIDIPNPQEQQKIADCLTSLDELIAAQVHKRDTLKAHKKGLMQQLFPNSDEGNG